MMLMNASFQGQNNISSTGAQLYFNEEELKLSAKLFSNDDERIQMLIIAWYYY